MHIDADFRVGRNRQVAAESHIDLQSANVSRRIPRKVEMDVARRRAVHDLAKAELRVGGIVCREVAIQHDLRTSRDVDAGTASRSAGRERDESEFRGDG